MKNIEITKKEKINIIKFYLNINGSLKIDKLQELLEKTNLNITKTELKDYIKEQNFKIEKNFVYANDFAYNMYQKFNNSNQEKLNTNYAIYSLTDIERITEELNQKDYIEKLYKILKPNFPDSIECFKFAETILNYIKYGYDIDENLNKVSDEKNLKGTKQEIRKLNKLIQEIYENIPSWELNGYIPKDKEIKLTKEEIENLLSYINMYMGMNGAIKIDKLLEILNKEHHFNINAYELIEISKIPKDIFIINNHFCVEGLDKHIVSELIDQKSKFPRYKVITNIDTFFEEYDTNETKLKKLINKYTDNLEVVNQVISLIRIGGINEYTLEMTLRSNKIILPDNKVARMLKDLQNCQKNVRIWSLNGYTMNELKYLK